MNIVQKIDTGGTSKTRTPMLKFRMNELLLPRDARHMTHWASVVVALKSRISASARRAKAVNNKYRIYCFKVLKFEKLLIHAAASARRLHVSLGLETV
jgi:hypothetical protein